LLSNDRICDTPPTANQNFSSGNTRQNTCNNDNPDLLDNVRNYMDYVPDISSNHFTAGQVARAHTVMNTASELNRFNLWRETNLEATGTGKWGPPKADFVAQTYATFLGTQRGLTHEGGKVSFVSYSRNTPTTFQWSFPGGSPATSTDPNPTVTYANAGDYDVTLIVSNLSGISDTLTKTGYVRVRDDFRTLPFTEGFQSGGTSLPSDWYVENRDFGSVFTRTWIPTGLGGGFGQSTRSVTLQNASYSNVGSVDGLISPPITLAGNDSASLAFSYAYELMQTTEMRFNLLLFDTLRVDVSTDGGHTWTQVWKKGGFDLAHTPTAIATEASALVQPAGNQWRRDTLSLQQFIDAGADHITLKFVNITGWGNNLFLDDITVTDEGYTAPTVSRAGQLRALGLQLFPNPTSGTARLEMELAQSGTVGYTLRDVTGRTVLQHSSPQAAGAVSLELDLTAQPAGVYFLQVTTPQGVETRRLVRN
jgi:PKD repeat protein